MRFHAALLTAALGLTACSSGPSTGAGGGTNFAQPTENRIFIEVANRNFDRATIWYETRGRRQRLGVVEGKNERTFTVRNWPSSAPIYLEIHLTGNQRCRTSELQADAGDQLYLEVSIIGVAGRC